MKQVSVLLSFPFMAVVWVVIELTTVCKVKCCMLMICLMS